MKHCVGGKATVMSLWLDVKRLGNVSPNTERDEIGPSKNERQGCGAGLFLITAPLQAPFNQKTSAPCSGLQAPFIKI